METSGIIFIACGGIFVLTIILIGCLGKMKEKRTVTNNQKSRDVTSDACGFTFNPAAASLPTVSSSAHHGWKMKETVANGPAKKPDNQRSTAPVTTRNGIGGGLMFLSAASVTASVSSNHGYGGGGGHHAGGSGGGHHDGGGCGGGGCGGG